MARLKEDVIKYPWVFSFRIKIRRDWFSYWWKTRGANFVEFQVWIFNITIGRPWHENPRIYYNEQKQLEHMKKTNEANLKAKFTFLVGSYDKAEKRLVID